MKAPSASAAQAQVRSADRVSESFLDGLGEKA
jgi:hypothetical protein